jgi:hypothetical protein
LFEDSGKALQYLIACGMTEIVINRLEPIQIQHAEAKRRSTPITALLFERQHFMK